MHLAASPSFLKKWVSSTMLSKNNVTVYDIFTSFS
nr:MAG TPA: hypothetical protein [Caudoviricetes sp.]